MNETLVQVFQGLVILLLTVIANYLRGISNSFKEVKDAIEAVKDDVTDLKISAEGNNKQWQMHEGIVHSGLDRRLNYLEHGKRGRDRNDDDE